MKKTAYSKRLSAWVIWGDLLLSIATLAISALSVLRGYTGGLPYLVSLIGIYNVATGYVLGKYMDKSKAENTKGGIVYDTAMNSVNTDRDC